jgi:aminoglycoside 6'-N-acetyltransferase
VRAGGEEDLDALLAILGEPSVERWWGVVSAERGEVARKLGAGELLVIEVDGAVAGGIEWYEETDPDYHHAGIDIYVASAFQDRGIGPEAIRLLARHLFDERGHHRLIIDPAVANERAIRAYEKVGFRRVGVMRQYERGRDGTFDDGLLMDMLRRELT